MSDKQIDKTFTIMKGRIIGFIFAFSIPFILSRELTISEYGSYKQIMLIWFVLTHTVHFGMDLGLFYFIKNKPTNGPLYSLNSSIFALLSSSCFSLALIFGREEISALFNNPNLAPLLPWFTVLLITSLPSFQFEYLLLISELTKKSMILEIFTEISKALIIVVAILTFHSLKIVIISLSILYLIRLILLLLFNIRRLDNSIHSINVMKKEFIKQLKYGLPLGAARVMLLIVHFDKLIISYIFPIRTFTIYAIGCFDIPLLPALGYTVRDIMSIEMAPLANDGQLKDALKLWITTSRRISIIVIPTTLFLFFYSSEIIITIFSSKYIESIPYFRIYIFIFMATIFDSEILFRVFAKSVQLMSLQFIMSLLSVVATILTALYLGPLMALTAKLIVTIISAITMMLISSKYLKSSVFKYFPWKEVTVTCLISVTILFPIYYLSSNLTELKLLSGLIGGALFFSTSILILSKLNIIKRDEIDIVLNKFRKKGVVND